MQPRLDVFRNFVALPFERCLGCSWQLTKHVCRRSASVTNCQPFLLSLHVANSFIVPYQLPYTPVVTITGNLEGALPHSTIENQVQV